MGSRSTPGLSERRCGTLKQVKKHKQQQVSGSNQLNLCCDQFSWRNDDVLHQWEPSCGSLKLCSSRKAAKVCSRKAELGQGSAEVPAVAGVRTDMWCSIFCFDCQQRNGVESSCVAFVSPNPSCLLLHFHSCALSSSTSCSPSTNSLFLAPIDRDEFIPSIASWHLVHILLLFSMFLSCL